jgi:hypothetical protein
MNNNIDSRAALLRKRLFARYSVYGVSYVALLTVCYRTLLNGVLRSTAADSGVRCLKTQGEE